MQTGDLAALKKLRATRQEVAASPLRALPGFAGDAGDLPRIRADLDAAAEFLALERDLTAAGLPPGLAETHRHELARASGGRCSP